MAKIPKELLVIESEHKLVMQLNNYDGNILAFQIIVIGVPLLILTFCSVAFQSYWVFLNVLLLAASVYWMIYNVNDRTEFVLTKNSFMVFEGMHQHKKIDVSLNDIDEVVIKKRERATSSTSWTTSERSVLTIYELYLHTRFEELLVTKNAGHKSVLFIKDLLEKQTRIE